MTISPTSAAYRDAKLACFQYAKELEMANLTLTQKEVYLNQCYAESFARSESSSMNESIRIPLYVLIFIVCVVGNTLVIVTLLQNRRMRTVTNIFLINLSVGDLLLGVFCMPVTLTGQTLKKFIFGAAMCKIIPYLQVVSVALSTFTLCSISIERYFAICCPLTSRRWQTVSHAMKMVVVCWVLAFMTGLPVLYFSNLEPYISPLGDGVEWRCRESYSSDSHELAYNLSLFTILFGLPGIFMSLAYLKITVTLLHAGVKGHVHNNTAKDSIAFSANDPANGSLAKLSSKLARLRAGSNGHQSLRDIRNGSAAGLSHHSAAMDGDGDALDTDTPLHTDAVTSPAESNYGQLGGAVRSTHSERNLQAKKRVVLMLIIVVFEFFICFTPLWIVNILFIVDDETTRQHIGALGMSYLQLLMYLSTCCNPITYCFLHSKFRQGMIQTFRCKKSKPELSDLLRTRTTKPNSYRANDSISGKSFNNVAVIPFSKSNSTKSLAIIKKASIPAATLDDELAKYEATSVNQSSEITWL